MQDSFSIYQSNGTDKAKLREIIVEIPGMISKLLVSGLAKNKQVSGDPASGSVKVSRFIGSTVRDYGTARGNGFGDKLKDNYVTVLLDEEKEVVEEVNNFDLRQYGLEGILEKRAGAVAFAYQNHLDQEFYKVAEDEGTEVTSEGDTVLKRFDSIVRAVATVKNGNVNGVPRGMIVVTLSPEAYDEVQAKIDELPNPVEGGVKIGTLHGVFVMENINQTEEMIAMAMGAIAQPSIISNIKFGEVPFSNEQAITFFFNYGTKCVMPDLVMYGSIVDSPTPSA